MNSLVILAAGIGSRANLGYNKMLYKIKGKTILEITLDKFENLDEFTETILVISQQDEQKIRNLLKDKNYKNLKIVYGSDQRYLSVYNGVINCKNEIIYVHDGARANISEKSIEKIKQEVKQNIDISCFALAQNVKDTISVVEKGYVKENLQRENLMALQTPQVIKKSIYTKIFRKDELFTDESSLFCRHGYKVKVIEGDDSNFKVTTELDLKRLEEIYE